MVEGNPGKGFLAKVIDLDAYRKRRAVKKDRQAQATSAYLSVLINNDCAEIVNRTIAERGFTEEETINRAIGYLGLYEDQARQGGTLLVVQKRWLGLRRRISKISLD